LLFYFFNIILVVIDPATYAQYDIYFTQDETIAVRDNMNNNSVQDNPALCLFI